VLLEPINVGAGLIGGIEDQVREMKRFSSKSTACFGVVKKGNIYRILGGWGPHGLVS
jgi:hypothetical protein